MLGVGYYTHLIDSLMRHLGYYHGVTCYCADDEDDEDEEEEDDDDDN